MKVIEVESQFYRFIRVHRPSSLAFPGNLQSMHIHVHISFAAQRLGNDYSGVELPLA